MSIPLLSPRAKRSKIVTTPVCILCSKECNENRSNFNIEAWNNLKETALIWKDLDRFTDVYESVDWEAGPDGSYFHKLCKTDMQNKRKIDQARKRVEKARKLKVSEEGDNLENANVDSSVSKRLTRQAGSLHEKHLCVWCMRPDQKKHGGQPLSLIQSWSAWNTFRNHTVHVEDEDMRNRLLALIAATPDPFATEIYYHRNCWKRQVKPVYDAKCESSSNSLDFVQNIRISEVTQLFFNHVNKVIFELDEPRTLKGLLMDYKNIASNFGFTTDNYTTAQVKNIIVKEFKDRIGFHMRYNKNESTIVYNVASGGSYVEAAINSWGVSDEQLLNNVARRLKTKMESDPGLTWPASVEDIINEEQPDPLLVKMLTWFKNPAVKDFQVCDDPVIVTLASLIKSFISGKRSSLQAKISCTIHGLTRSRELVDLFKKIGIGISYQDVKNLYASWTNAELTGNTSPVELAEHFPATAIMDNDDFKDDTLTGANTSHRTNVMFVQPVNLISMAKPESLSLVKPGDIKHLADEQNKITPYKTIKKGIPAVREKIDTSVPKTNEIRTEQMIHTMVRLDNRQENIEPSEQSIGSFAGFQSLVQNYVVPSKAYYFLTLPKPPHKSVVNEVMSRLNVVMSEKNIPFMQLVGDQPVYTLIVQLKNENFEKFKNVIPVLGPFHTQCSFITVINKRFSGSGIAELIVSADIISDKSVDQAFRAKHYRRIVRALQLLYEALQRSVIKMGIKGGISVSEDVLQLLDKVRTPLNATRDQIREYVNKLKESADFKQFMEDAYKKIEEMDSSMARYWLSFMEMVEILIMNIHAVKTQNWDMFLESLRLMIPWMQIYDNNKYGKWLVEFWVEMSSLSERKVEYLKNGLFAQSITGNPYTCLPLDLWIEVTMNKGSKLKAGWKQILKNETMILCHTRNANAINKIRVSLHDFVDLRKEGNGKHRENTRTRLRLDELAVQDLENCIIEFDCNPFDMTNTTLRTLQSGEKAMQALINDFETALEDGEKLTRSFLEERMFSRKTPFDAVMHKNSRKSFKNPPVDKNNIDIVPSKSDAMENKAMSEIVSICCNNNVSLSAIMEHRITEECLSIFNTNGTMVKVQKSKLLDTLSFIPLPKSDLENNIAIVDMGFIWRLATPTIEDREKDDETFFIWHDYAAKIFNMIIYRHSIAKTVILVNDPYDLEINIKDSEHDRRSKYIGGTKNIFIRPNDKLPNSQDLNAFFKNSGNKIRLQQFIQEEFMIMARSEPKNIIYSIRNTCVDLKNIHRLEEYECYQTEADSIMFYIYSQLRKSDKNSTVVIDAEDTDVVVMAARVSHEVPGVLGIKRKKIIYDCRRLCSLDLSEIIVQFHVHTGCDAISGFFGHGKKSVMKRITKSQDLYPLLKDVGTSIPADESTYLKLRQFTLKVVYNDRSNVTLANSRAAKWSKMRKKSTKRLPPDENSHELRAKRVNYICHLLLNYKNKEAPSSPFHNGWVKVDGKCLPVRHTNSALPANLAALYQHKHENMKYDEDESDVSDVIETDDESDTISDNDY